MNLTDIPGRKSPPLGGIETSADSPALRHRPLMELTVDVEDELVISRKGLHSRLSVCYFRGGRFEGERLSGVVLPGGGDWADVRTPDHVEIDVRGMLRTVDGALIYLKYTGLWCTPPGVLHRVIAAGGDQHYRPEENYFRTVARFETSAAQYDWLNRIIAVGVGSRTGAGVGHSFFEIV